MNSSEPTAIPPNYRLNSITNLQLAKCGEYSWRYCEDMINQRRVPPVGLWRPKIWIRDNVIINLNFLECYLLTLIISIQHFCSSFVSFSIQFYKIIPLMKDCVQKFKYNHSLYLQPKFQLHFLLWIHLSPLPPYQILIHKIKGKSPA